jgi:hypothetical protein
MYTKRYTRVMNDKIAITKPMTFRRVDATVSSPGAKKANTITDAIPDVEGNDCTNVMYCLKSDIVV